MITEDYRIDKEILKNIVGNNFVKYKCDPFVFTNSVYSIVGIYTDVNTYCITNKIQSIDYFGTNEDVGIFSISESGDESIKSSLADTTQIETIVNEKIESIDVIEEHQQLFRERLLEYDVYFTRAIIFKTKTREYCFEKDDFEFSEQIIINRGNNLRQKFDNMDFKEKQSEFEFPYHLVISQEIITLK